MRYMPIMGQCSAFIAAKLSEIGFRNIENMSRDECGVFLTTKHDGHGTKTYKVSVELVEEYIGPLKTNNNANKSGDSSRQHKPIRSQNNDPLSDLP